jgi:hypothetical protein
MKVYILSAVPIASFKGRKPYKGFIILTAMSDEAELEKYLSEMKERAPLSTADYEYFIDEIELK